MRLILTLASLFVRGTALMLALVGAIAGLACLGGAFSDRLDAATHLAPIWLTCGAAGLILSLGFARDLERKAIAGLSMIAILALLILMAPELLSALRRPQPPAPGAVVLKLVQFNVWEQNYAPEATADWLQAQDADVVLMEEAGRAAWPIVNRMDKIYPYRLACPSKRGCDTVILSRWPIVAQHDFTRDRQHLHGGWVTVRHPSGDFTVAGAHFVWPIPAGPQQAQSRALVAALAQLPHDTLILTGDFNSTPWSWSLRRQDRALGLERRTRALASWPSGAFSRLADAPFPVLPIDHVYAGKAWNTVKVERGPALGSDHRPVVVTLNRR
jgi:endonuclease/exonuclease/phosphatase (EEP) superfamily protein YafD